jgi:exosortase
MTSASRWPQVDVRVVVLVGGRDFGRCPLGARLPAALWPIADTPVLLRLLDHLADGGIERAVVYCGKDVSADVEAVCRGSRLEVSLVTEGAISGTGGAVRDAVASDPGDLILMLSGSMVAPPPVAGLIEAHLSRGADMTVVFNPGWPDEASPGSPAEIFLCRPEVLGHIPCGGYADIKEGVIPAVLRAGGIVHPLVLEKHVGNFRDRQGYLDALDAFFQEGVPAGLGFGTDEPPSGDSVFKGVDTLVHREARVCGPVLIGDRARVLPGAVVIGPAVIGRDVVVGEDSVMVRAVLWAGATVGARCEIRESIVDRRVTIPDGMELAKQAVSGRISDYRTQVRHMGTRGKAIIERAKSYLDSGVAELARWVRLPPKHVAALLGGAAVFVALLWSYWPTVANLIYELPRSQEYSSGVIVPFLAAYVIWSRREDIGSTAVRPAMLWGTAAFLFAQSVRGAGLYLMFQSAERLSLVLTIASLVLLIQGWRRFIKLAPILLFLVLMLPWPNQIQATVALPLQRWATRSAVFCLELVGYGAVRSGNLITIEGVTVNVAEACNGLRMITAFFVISGLVVLLVRRTWWEKLIVLMSSLPIALLCNTLRLAGTAMLYTVVESETGRDWIHDSEGYAMMPLALAMVVGELWLLSRLTTPPAELEPAVISRRQPQHVPDP